MYVYKTRTKTRRCLILVNKRYLINFNANISHLHSLSIDEIIKVRCSKGVVRSSSVGLEIQRSQVQFPAGGLGVAFFATGPG